MVMAVAVALALAAPACEPVAVAGHPAPGRNHCPPACLLGSGRRRLTCTITPSGCCLPAASTALFSRSASCEKQQTAAGLWGLAVR
jgi:hypothetical protein